MPKPGYKAVTIGEEAYDRIKESMEKFNEKAGVKRFRNISHFVEEAIVNYAVGEIKQSSESPEEVMQKVVEIVMNREDLLKSVFKRLAEMPHEEASELIQKVMTKDELAKLKKICTGGKKK